MPFKPHQRPEVVQPTDQSIRYIPLTQGKVAVVDATDYDFLSSWSWFARHHHGNWYAVRKICHNGKERNCSMQNCITGYLLTDHINGDGLDNRKCNLRKATHAQNMRNSKLRSHSRNGFKGISPDGKKWDAKITINKKQLFLGTFPSKTAAANAYDSAAKKYFGEFARLNFPDHLP